jgi:hypothetical protein
MIVVDANVIAYLLIEGEFTESVTSLRSREPEWIAPRLWLDEFLNILATSERHSILSAEVADGTLALACELMEGQLVVHATSIDGFRGSRVGMPLRGIRRTFNHARGRLGEPSLPPDAESGNPSYHLAQTTRA